MKKACLLATGFFIVLLGVQCLLIKKVVLKINYDVPVAGQKEVYQKTPCEVNLSPVVGWCIITIGGCFLFYTLAGKR